MNDDKLGMVSGFCMNIFDKSHHIIMVQDESGKPLVNGQRGYGLPGGRIETGESPSDALFREWHEEVGIEGRNIPVFLEDQALIFEKQGVNNETYKHFVIPITLGPSPKPLRQTGMAGETLAPEWIKLTDIAKMNVPVFPSHINLIFEMLKPAAIKNINVAFAIAGMWRNYQHIISE
ncbi:MAG: NUDIX hydrolase [Candidatus Marinimicrobia bacterium]|nr:NUDIX hydrolase [Candidatus Neomarinimicrobiota bacterium]